MKFKKSNQKQESVSNFEKLWEALQITDCQTIINEKEISLTFEASIGNRRVQVKSPTFASLRPVYVFEDRESDAAQFIYYAVFENQEMKKLFTEEKFVRSLPSEFREYIDRLLIEQAKEKLSEKFVITSVREKRSDEGIDFLVFSMGEKGAYQREFSYIPRDNGGYLSFHQEARGKIEWLDFFETECNASLELNFPVTMKSNKQLFMNQVIHELVLMKYRKTEEYRLKTMFG